MKWRPDTTPFSRPGEMPNIWGLTKEEGRVMGALCNAIGLFDQLEVQHPNDTHEFYSLIHGAQDLMAVRIARRLYPEGWPSDG